MFNDENGDPIEISGVYSSKSCYGWDFAKPHITFYRVSQLNQDANRGVVLDHHGNVYELMKPRGLPDSSRVPEGFLDPSDLHRIRMKDFSEGTEKVQNHIKNLVDLLGFFSSLERK
jgi:hypothetical protein